MAYSTEKLAKDLKAAREAKGLSQRALSDRVGVPQSHISKIENGRVDLRLSSLVEIARALDLEMMLVPRKNLSAVRSITRPRPSVPQDVVAVEKAGKELQRLQKTLAKLSAENPAVKELAQLQRRVNDLNQLTLPNSAVEQLKKIDDSLRLPSAALAETKRINHSLQAPQAAAETLREIQASLHQVQLLRNQHVHSLAKPPGIEKVRPAYSLEDDDHG